MKKALYIASSFLAGFGVMVLYSFIVTVSGGTMGSWDFLIALAFGALTVRYRIKNAPPSS